MQQANPRIHVFVTREFNSILLVHKVGISLIDWKMVVKDWRNVGNITWSPMQYNYVLQLSILWHLYLIRSEIYIQHWCRSSMPWKSIDFDKFKLITPSLVTTSTTGKLNKKTKPRENLTQNLKTLWLFICIYTN